MASGDRRAARTSAVFTTWQRLDQAEHGLGAMLPAQQERWVQQSANVARWVAGWVAPLKVRHD